jgi:hypothetical protein
MDDRAQLVEPAHVRPTPALPINTSTTGPAVWGMDLAKFEMRALYTARALKVKRLRRNLEDRSPARTWRQRPIIPHRF